MTNPISTISAASAARRSTTDAAIANRTTGLSSVSDSMSSVAIATANGQGCWATITGFFASIWENIRSCLAKLPCIGKWFEAKPAPSPTPTSTPVTTPTPSPAPTLSDRQMLDMIKSQFPDATVAPPDEHTVNDLIDKFKKLNTPIAKIEAFNTIINATNSTPEICKRFYGALPVGGLSEAQLISGNREASQTSFRYQMFRSNPTGAVFNGVDLGADFGKQMVDNHIRSNVAKNGARRLADTMQLETFQAAIAATNATDDSVRAAWKALPQALRNEMAGEIWNINRANGGNDGGNANYGSDVAQNTPRDVKVAQAARNLRNNKL